MTTGKARSGNGKETDDREHGMPEAVSREDSYIGDGA
jgi:hypothetical protein